MSMAMTWRASVRAQLQQRRSTFLSLTAPSSSTYLPIPSPPPSYLRPNFSLLHHHYYSTSLLRPILYTNTHPSLYTLPIYRRASTSRTKSKTTPSSSSSSITSISATDDPIKQLQWLATRPPSSSLSEAEAKTELSQLDELLTHHDSLYYQQDAPLLSDADYDRLLRRAGEVANIYPSLRPLVRRLEEVGGSAAEAGAKGYSHEIPMLSLDNVFSIDQLSTFIRKIQSTQPSASFSVEPKVDGLSLSLKYKGGRLWRAGTRGDGREGEDVTVVAQELLGVPTQLPEEAMAVIGESGSVEVRGEVYMDRATLTRLQAAAAAAAREEEGDSKGEGVGGPVRGFATSRNAAAGTLRQGDPAVARARGLRFFAFQMLDYSINSNNSSSDNSNSNSSSSGLPDSQTERLALLSQWGFPVAQPSLHCHTEAEVIAAVEALGEARPDLAFDTDGAVIKLDSVEGQLQLGTTRKAPRYSVAFKFSGEEATTILESINVQVGRTGVLTPVANLRAVKLGGVQVSRATLHNAAEVDRLGLRPGDLVRVVRSGDVIPKIVGRVVEEGGDEVEGREEAFEMPSQCPVCGSPVVISENGTSHRCTGGLRCRAQLAEGLAHFCSQGALDIEGLGPRRVETLLDHGLISDVADIFTLKEREVEAAAARSAAGAGGKGKGKGKGKAVKAESTTFSGSLCDIPGWGQKSVDNLLANIEKRRRVTFPRFLYALGIPSVGQQLSEDIAAAFDSFDDLWTYLSGVGSTDGYSRLMGIHGLGGKSLDRLLQFASDPAQQELIQKLTKQLVIINTKEPSISSEAEVVVGDDSHSSTEQEGNGSESLRSLFSGKLVCITGTFERNKRADLVALVAKHGGKVSDRLTKSVDLLLIGGAKEGAAMSSKQRAALALGTTTLTETELETALHG